MSLNAMNDKRKITRETLWPGNAKFWGTLCGQITTLKRPNVFEEAKLKGQPLFCTHRPLVLLENAILWPFRHNSRSLAAFRNFLLTHWHFLSRLTGHYLSLEFVCRSCLPAKVHLLYEFEENLPQFTKGKKKKGLTDNCISSRQAIAIKASFLKFGRKRPNWQLWPDPSSSRQRRIS